MKAMILAAGLGERMRPLTLERAKSSLPLFNKSFILHAVDYLVRFGVRDIAINLHHQPDSITSLFRKETSPDLNIRFSHEPQILGTAGGVKKVEDFFNDEPFILMNSDFVSDINLDEVIAFHKKDKPLATLILQKSKTKEYSSVKVEMDGRIEAIGATDGNHIFCGLHIVEPEILQYIPFNKKADINKDIYSSLIAQGVILKAYEHSGYWFEFGSLQKYLLGHIELARRGSGFIRELLNINLPNTIFQPEHAPPNKTARVRGFLCLGERCNLEEGTFVEDSILHNSVVLSEGADVSKCIIGENVKIPAGMKLHGSAVALVPAKKSFKEEKEEYLKRGSLLIKKFLD
jgi:NDP-sugar pyrophosphorylase family protein